MDQVVLYHNPRCSKSRAALALLEERGVPLRIVEYMQTPLGRRDLEDLGAKLRLPPREWARTKESAWAEAGLGEASSAAEILDAMAVHPILMERPIAVVGERARVGRPPERVLELVDEAGAEA
jgi:arsenate reductase